MTYDMALKMDGNIRIKVYGKFRNIYVTDVDNCKDYKCFHPYGGMCLTNANHGCPDRVIRKDFEKVSDAYIKSTEERQ